MGRARALPTALRAYRRRPALYPDLPPRRSNGRALVGDKTCLIDFEPPAFVARGAGIVFPPASRKLRGQEERSYLSKVRGKTR